MRACVCNTVYVQAVYSQFKITLLHIVTCTMKKKITKAIIKNFELD